MAIADDAIGGLPIGGTAGPPPGAGPPAGPPAMGCQVCCSPCTPCDCNVCPGIGADMSQYGWVTPYTVIMYWFNAVGVPVFQDGTFPCSEFNGTVGTEYSGNHLLWPVPPSGTSYPCQWHKETSAYSIDFYYLGSTDPGGAANATNSYCVFYDKASGCNITLGPPGGDESLCGTPGSFVTMTAQSQSCVGGCTCSLGGSSEPLFAARYSTPTPGNDVRICTDCCPSGISSLLKTTLANAGGCACLDGVTLHLAWQLPLKDGSISLDKPCPPYTWTTVSAVTVCASDCQITATLDCQHTANAFRLKLNCASTSGTDPGTDTNYAYAIPSCGPPLLMTFNGLTWKTPPAGTCNSGASCCAAGSINATVVLEYT